MAKRKPPSPAPAKPPRKGVKKAAKKSAANAVAKAIPKTVPKSGAKPPKQTSVKAPPPAKSHSHGEPSLERVVSELQHLGSATTKATLMRHGAREPFYGVRVGDMKPIVKRIAGNHALALALYDTGNSDAMYLAGLAIDPQRMTKAELNKWAQGAYWYMLSQYTVAWVAAESPHGWELGREWIDGKTDMMSTAGWATLSNWVMVRPDEKLDLAALKKLLARVEKEIAKAPNRTRSAMNGFVIAVGQCVRPLYDAALAIADRIGQVEIDVGDTSCKIPVAGEYLRAMAAKGKLGYKKKQARC